jgi:hypothetical protein
MNDIAIWLFAGAVYGTLAFPFVLGVAAWRAPAGRRRRRALVVGLVTAAAVVGVAWTIDVAMLVWAVGLGVH